MSELRDRTVLVTGGGSGIGRVIARHFADEGARVVVSGRREAPLLEACQGRDGMSWLTFDVTREADWDAALPQLRELVGDIQVLVACAGMIERAPFIDSDPGSWERMWRTNVLGSMLAARALLPGMLSGGWGRLVFVSSVVATTAMTDRTGYTMTKGAIESFMRSLAVEVAGRGVTSNAIAPGAFRTDLTEAALAEDSPFAIAARRAIPEGQFGSMTDLGRTAQFLVECDYTQGTTIHVDGGWSISGGA